MNTTLLIVNKSGNAKILRSKRLQAYTIECKRINTCIYRKIEENLKQQFQDSKI